VVQGAPVAARYRLAESRPNQLSENHRAFEPAIARPAVLEVVRAWRTPMDPPSQFSCSFIRTNRLSGSRSGTSPFFGAALRTCYNFVVDRTGALP
jgi:hypothetical protein